jgi:hypothetical protein
MSLKQASGKGSTAAARTQAFFAPVRPGGVPEDFFRLTPWHLNRSFHV